MSLKTWFQRGSIAPLPPAQNASDGSQRCVTLERSMLKPSDLEKMRKDPLYNNVYEDLLHFTGLCEEDLNRRLLRSPETHFQSEFRWHAPQTHEQLLWFYRCSYGYVFANAAHSYWTKLDCLKPGVGRVLDYGAGIGNNVLTLAQKGFEVDAMEIGILQSEFLRYRVTQRGLRNVKLLSPFVENRFDPIQAITGPYGAIILKDVLEHVPEYPVLLRHLIGHLVPEGVIVENTDFDASASEVELHLKPSMPLEEAMVGMQKVDKGVWKKK